MSTDHAPAVSIEDVSKRYRLYREKATSLKETITRFRRARYDEFWALRDISLEVPQGSVYGFIGHNGSGKSTLLRLVAGVQTPNEGRIATNGRISALLELGAGFHPDLTGRENVYLNAAILGLTRREIDRRFDDIVDFSGLSEFIDTPVKVYSSGMYVRLGFSVAVHVNPDILIIDEVIAVGDEEFQRRCFEHIYELRQRDVTIVMVTHSLGLVRSMCDRAAWLDHGHLRAEGPAAEVVVGYLGQVDEEEEERLAAQGAEHPEAHAEGAPREEIDVSAPFRPISVEGVEFLDAGGEPTVVARTGAPLRVRLHYDASQPVESPLFSFAVENVHGLHLATPGMRPGAGPSVTLDGRGHVDYEIDRLVLTPGEYVLSVAVHDSHGLVRFHHRERAYSLKVQAGDDPFGAGAIDLLGRWTVPSSSRKEAAS